MSSSTLNQDTATSSSDLIHLDGRTLEGGGQLLRLALSLSSLTGRGIHVTDIRGNRTRGHGRKAKKGGGLKTSHYECARWLAALTGATTEGLEVGSSELIFRPSLDRAVDIDVIIDMLSMQQKQLVEQRKTVADGEGDSGRAERARGGKKGGDKARCTARSASTVEGETVSNTSSSISTTPASLLLAAADRQIPLDELLPPKYRNSSLDDFGISPDRPRCFTIQQKTPGAVLLVLQAMLPYLLFGPFSLPRPSAKIWADRQTSQNATGNVQPATSTSSLPSVFGSSSSTSGPAQQPQPLNLPEIRLNIVGGTNVSGSPSFEYAQQVLLPTLENIVGVPFITAQLSQRGWSSPPSRGGGSGGNQLGSVYLRIQPLPAGTPLPAFNVFREPGQENSKRYTLKRINVSIIAHPLALLKELEEELVAEMEHRFRDGGLNGSPVPVHVKLREDSGRRNRVYILAVAHIDALDLQSALSLSHTAPKPPIPLPSPPNPSRPKTHLLGRDILLDGSDKTNPQPRDLAKRLARELRDDVASGRLVDEHMQDQLVVFQALAAGRSTVDAGPRGEVTLHTQTARWVAERILEGLRFDDGGGEEAVGMQGGSSCVGVGFVPGSHVSDGNKVRSGSETGSEGKLGSERVVEGVGKLAITNELPKDPS